MKKIKTRVTQDTIDKYHLLHSAGVKGAMMEKVLGIAAPTISVIKRFKTLEEYNAYNQEKAKEYRERKLEPKPQPFNFLNSDMDMYNTIMTQLRAANFGIAQISEQLKSKKIIF